MTAILILVTVAKRNSAKHQSQALNEVAHVNLSKLPTLIITNEAFSVIVFTFLIWWTQGLLVCIVLLIVTLNYISKTNWKYNGCIHSTTNILICFWERFWTADKFIYLYISHTALMLQLKYFFCKLFTKKSVQFWNKVLKPYQDFKQYEATLLGKSNTNLISLYSMSSL